MKLELIQISKKDFEDLTSTHIDTRNIAKFENEKLETTAVIKALEFADGISNIEKAVLIHLSTPNVSEDKYYRLVLNN